MRTKLAALVAALAITAIATPAAFANDGRPTQPGKADGAQSLDKKSLEKKTRTPARPDSADRTREPGKIIYF